MSDLAEQVLAIGNAKARYCAAADLMASDPDTARKQLATVLADDFVGEFGWDPLHGAEALGDFLAGSVGVGSAWMIHLLSSPEIAIDGTRATGRWTVAVRTKRREDGQLDWVVGRYADELRLEPDGWRLTRIHFTQLT